MATLNTTPNRAYQEPFGTNDLATDVGRIISALRAIDADVADAFAQIVDLAPKTSPALTGTPTAPTAVAGTSTNQLATTAFVASALAALVDSSPDALDTLNELAAALGDDPNFSATVLDLIATKADAAATTAALAEKVSVENGSLLSGLILDPVQFADPSDNTKRGRFDVGAVTSGQNRVYTLPDRSLVLNPAWEQIGPVISPSSAILVSWNNLSDYWMWELSGFVAPQGVPSGFGVQVSVDNGATWKTASTDYRRHGVATVGSGTPVNIAAVADTYFVNSSENQVINEILSFSIRITSLGLSRVTFDCSSLTVGSTTGNRIKTLSGGDTNFASEINAIRFLGNVSYIATGKLLLRGVRK